MCYDDNPMLHKSRVMKPNSWKHFLNVCVACKKISVPIDWTDIAPQSWCRNNVWQRLEGSGGREGEKVLSNIYTGVIWLHGARSWHPKFLVGQASVTVGGSFCQERRMESHEKLSASARGRERGEWTTDRRDIRKESEKVNRQFIAQWSKKGERWKALTWVKLRVMGRKGNRNTKSVLEWGELDKLRSE